MKHGVEWRGVLALHAKGLANFWDVHQLDITPTIPFSVLNFQTAFALV
jgi:hypothetical protein